MVRDFFPPTIYLWTLCTKLKLHQGVRDWGDANTLSAGTSLPQGVLIQCLVYDTPFIQQGELLVQALFLGSDAAEWTTQGQRSTYSPINAKGMPLFPLTQYQQGIGNRKLTQGINWLIVLMLNLPDHTCRQQHVQSWEKFCISGFEKCIYSSLCWPNHVASNDNRLTNIFLTKTMQH